ncbi:hypothetical protein [Epilithonimonas lactis]|uniref:Uncharacterized protein n=1 Tax=Epilithonimonas lactis TaxID=421072 RepID=A0A085BL70_9FLAO|nr:hypothetical protein [Epilithonimonas lactis]KFC23215.1 hypothetical protein IO89_01055 [Epilithonimonas lactis]
MKQPIIKEANRYLDSLGCLSYAIFECKEDLSTSEILCYLAEIYRFRTPSEYNKESDKWLNQIFGPLKISKLSLDDFSFISFSKINSKIQSYMEMPDWGVDLAIFKKNWDEVCKLIEKENLLDSKFYYINIDEIGRENLKENHPQVQFYTYFIGLFAIDKKSQRLFVIDLSED